MALDNMQFDWGSAMERQSDPSYWNLLSQTPWAGTSANPTASGEWSPTGEYIPEGYQLGFNKLNNVGTWALRDPSGKIVNSYQGSARDSFNSSDYATMIAMGSLGYGLAGGLGAAAGGAGAAETGAGLGAAEGAGTYFGGAQFGGAGLGDSALLTGGGGLTSGASFGGAAGAAGGATATGAGLGGLSGNTWANLGQMGVGLLAQNRATNAMKDANNAQLGLQREMYQQNRADNQPLLDLRNAQLPRLNNLLMDPGKAMDSDPFFGFERRQGQNALDNKFAAAGGYYSGNQLKASADYNRNMAGSQLDRAVNRITGAINLGQIGGTNNQNNNNNFGQQQGNALMNGGNIRGSSYMGMANTIGSGIGNIYNNNQQDYWNQQRNPFGGPGS